jgi:hypothetical protein
MPRTETLNDPIVEILQFAYRRGLVILQEQREHSKSANTLSLDQGTSKVRLDGLSSEAPPVKKVKSGK